MFHSYRSHIIFVVLILFLAVPLIALSATDASPQKMLALTMFNNYVNDLPGFFNRLMNMSIFIGALLAVVMISIGGVQYMTSEAVGSIENAKQRITHAILGLLMLLSVYIFYNQINPDILKLDFTLKTANVDTSKPTEPKPAPKPLSKPLLETSPGLISKDCGPKTQISCDQIVSTCKYMGIYTTIDTSQRNKVICKTPERTASDNALIKSLKNGDVGSVREQYFEPKNWNYMSPSEKNNQIDAWTNQCEVGANGKDTGYGYEERTTGTVMNRLCIKL